MPADPPDIDFVVAAEPAGADEELPEPARLPGWLRARVPLAGAAAVLVLIAALIRTTSSGPSGKQPAAAPGSPRPSSGAPTFSLTFPGGDLHVIRMGPHHIGTEPPCDVLPLCIVTEGAPDSVLDALKDYLPGAHVTFASTSADRTGIAGRHHRFRSTTVQARRGPVAISITVARTIGTDDRPTHAGERHTAFGTRIYARAYLPGYFISIEVTAPSGRAPTHVDKVVALAMDPRLRSAR